jgi:PGF-CTERM protein
MTIPDGEYDVGDDVIVTVHVFREGEYHTPDDVILWLSSNDREIGLTEEAEGRFKGVVTIASDDLDSYGDLNLEAEASDGSFPFTDSATDWDYIETLAGAGFDVAIRLVDAIDIYPIPGQEVEFRVHVTHLGNPVDPDTETLEVGYEDPAGTEHMLTTTRVGTGLFEGTLTVPANLKESSAYYMWATAEYTHDSITLEEEAGQELYVQFYHVWAHITDVTPSESAVAVYVIGLDGLAIADAQVVLDWVYLDDAEDEIEDTTSGTSDAEGMVAFTIEYTDLGMEEYEVLIDGRITLDGYTQLYDGVIYVREAPGWDGGGGDGFIVDITNPGPYEGGESITVNNVATYDGEFMADTLIYFYLTDGTKMYRFGSATTDAEGEFTFPLNLPELDEDEVLRFIQVYFHLPEDPYWRTAYSSIEIGEFSMEILFDEWIDPGVTLDVPAFSAGETVKVTLDHADADGVEEQAMLIWGIGPLPEDFEDFLNLEWESWVPGSAGFMEVVPFTWVADQFETTFSCPAFLTTDQELFMYGIIVFLEHGDDFDAAKAAKIDSVSPVPPNPPPEAGITSPTDAQAVGGKVKIKGTAGDDTDVVRVEVRVDGGAWETAEGTTSWTYEVDTSDMAEGNHTVEVRSYDGEKYSDPEEVTFEVDHSKAPKEDDSPGFGLLIAFLSMMGAVLMARRRR